MAKAERCVESEEKERKVDESKRNLLKFCGWNPQKPAEKAIEYYTFDFDSAVPPERISCGIQLRSGGEIQSEGDNQALVNDKRGYAKIIEDMAKDFWEKIKYYKVTNILKEKRGTEITVRVKGGQTFTAEHVLVTFSIGVLQRNMDTMFSPPLSQPFGAALKKMKMANYLKIFMKFKLKKFWQEKDYMFYAPKSDQERRLFPVWQNLPGKLRTTTSHGNEQYVPDNNMVLLVTVTGDEAWRLRRATEAAIENKLFPIFKNVFKINAKDYHVATHFKNWGDDELFLGAYSNPGIGMTSSDFDILTSPVEEFGNRLYFAGEGTSELYYGFLHGAYLTGIEQAKKIITVIKFQEAQNSLAGNMLLRNLGATRNGTIHLN